MQYVSNLSIVEEEEEVVVVVVVVIVIVVVMAVMPLLTWSSSPVLDCLSS